MSYSPVNPNGQATSANSAPVVIASDQSAVSVTANAGTNLNTSALALETGGNLATVATNTTGLNNSVGTAGSAIPSKGLIVQGSDGTNARAIKTDTSGQVAVNIQNSPTVTAKLQDGSGNSINSTSNALNVNLSSGGFATATNQTGGSQKTQIVDGSGNVIGSSNNNLSVNVGAGAGTSTIATGSIGNTVTSVKGSAGNVYGWYIYNNNSAVSYVQFFNLATGSVTLGTTAPLFSIGIPAYSASNVFGAVNIPFSTAISIAITTTRAGSTSPTNTVDYNIFGA